MCPLEISPSNYCPPILGKKSRKLIANSPNIAPASKYYAITVIIIWYLVLGPVNILVMWVKIVRLCYGMA